MKRGTNFTLVIVDGCYYAVILTYLTKSVHTKMIINKFISLYKFLLHILSYSIQPKKVYKLYSTQPYTNPYHFLLQMPIDTWQAIKAVFGFAFIGTGVWLTVKNAKQRRTYSKLDQLVKQSQKCSLNQRSLRKEKQASRQHANQMRGRAVCIEKVTAHFMDKNYPHVKYLSNKNDDYAKIQCSPFWVVEKNFSKAQYQMYQVKVNKTWASQHVLIPDQSSLPTNKQANLQYLPTILTSACTLGIVGTLTLDSSSQYVIEAKIIGRNLQEIQEFISSELLWKGFYAVLGGVMVIAGMGVFINMYRDYKRARVPLEASLLDF